MVAVVPMFDPPRIDTKETIERCIEKGIMVKMVTGDQLLIGKETAKQLGMGQNFYTTEELMEARPLGKAAALSRRLGRTRHCCNIRQGHWNQRSTGTRLLLARKLAQAAGHGQYCFTTEGVEGGGPVAKCFCATRTL